MIAPRVSRIVALQEQERTKNEKKDTRERDKSRVNRCRCVCSIVCCFNRTTPHLNMRRLDFPYKKRTSNPVQIFPNLTELVLQVGLGQQFGFPYFWGCKRRRMKKLITSKL